MFAAQSGIAPYKLFIIAGFIAGASHAVFDVAIFCGLLGEQSLQARFKSFCRARSAPRYLIL
jgi:hypothetical protein